MFYDADIDAAVESMRDEAAGLNYVPGLAEATEEYENGTSFPDNEFYKGVLNYHKVREDNGFVLAVTFLPDGDYQYANWQVNQYGRGLDNGHYAAGNRDYSYSDYRKRAELDVVDVAGLLHTQGLFDENVFTLKSTKKINEFGNYLTMEVSHGDVSIKEHYPILTADTEDVKEVYNSINDMHERHEIRDIVNRKVNDCLAELYPDNFAELTISDQNGYNYDEYKDFFSDKETDEFHKFLSDLVEDKFGSDKKCDVYYDYRDEVAPEIIGKGFDSIEKHGGYLKDYLYEHYSEMFYDYDSEQLESIESEIENCDNEVFKKIYEKETEKDYPGGLSDYLYNVAGYEGIDINLDDLLKRSEFKVNLLLATKQEINHDMCSVVNCYGNNLEAIETERLQTIDFDNALTYLIHQQGYTVEEVYDTLLFNKETDSKFIKSLVSELDNCTYTMNNLTVLLQLDGNQLVDLHDDIDENDNITLSKDCMLGLYNKWNGSGSILELELERDLVIPKSMIFDSQIEGVKRNYEYTVDHTYGLCGDAWVDGYEGKSEQAPELKVEDMEQMLHNIKDKEMTALYEKSQGNGRN